MNTKLLTAFALLAAASAAGLSAQVKGGALKIGVIDMQSALVSTKEGQKAIADLKAKYGPRNDDLQKRQQELQAKQDQYRRTQNTLSDEAKATLERDIDTLTRSYQRDGQFAKDEMDQDQQAMVEKLGGKIMQVVSKYATDNHFTMIFDASGQPANILFASTAIDITRDIIALYDKQPPADAPATDGK